uniref:Neurotransmitter-gated ion-channel ligand-binding domain-containing protein n=1 Tax=Strigamia maritima TaxID=126957 RepID=T1JD82_STRMM
MDFSVDIRLRIEWIDNRITKNFTGYKVLTKNIMRKIFYPRLEFINCKACHSLITDPEKYSFLLVSKQKILHKYRNKIDFNCNFDLSRYPFDVQICQIDFQLTVATGKVNLSLEADKNEYKQMDKKKLPIPSEYLIKDIEVLEIDCPRKKDTKNRFCFRYKYTFQREVLQHLLVTFVPSILIVMLSWISFFLDSELAAPRVALGQTSLLTLAAQFNNAQRNLPSASNVKALDIWMFVCISLAFGSLVEFAFAYNFSQMGKKPPAVVQIPTLTLVRNNKVEPERKGAQRQQPHESQPQNTSRSRKIDFWAKILFPSFFFIFNIVFWMYYL